MINDERRVIGQLHGGFSHCTSVEAPVEKLFGRFDISWLGYNNHDEIKTKRLKDWLDPNETGHLVTNTIEAVELAPQIVHRTVTTGQTHAVYPLYAVPDATGYIWEWTYHYNSNEAYLFSTNGYASVSFTRPNNAYTLQARPIYPISGAYLTPAFIYNFQVVSYQTKSISAYPNPVSDILNVKIEKNENEWDSDNQMLSSKYDEKEFLIQLFDTNGNLLYREFANEGIVQLNLSRQSSGLYYLIVNSNINKELKSEQIVIVKQ